MHWLRNHHRTQSVLFRFISCRFVPIQVKEIIFPSLDERDHPHFLPFLKEQHFYDSLIVMVTTTVSTPPPTPPPLTLSSFLSIVDNNNNKFTNYFNSLVVDVVGDPVHKRIALIRQQQHLLEAVSQLSFIPMCALILHSHPIRFGLFHLFFEVIPWTDGIISKHSIWNYCSDLYKYN